MVRRTREIIEKKENRRASTHDENFEKSPIVFFDGVCNLCNGAVQFILKHEKEHRLFFAPLQGETFRKIHEKQKTEFPDSIVLYQAGALHVESGAVLRIARHLTGAWRFLSYPAWVLPPFIRDALYRFIARNRYRWFGKKETCFLPTPELRSRFLE